MAKVIIIGGGVAGMSAAHELSERGFEVEIYERNPVYCGGKARSIDVPGNPPGTIPLPGEHGFRFFPGFYQHIPDTMKRIPDGSGKTVFDHLTPTEFILLARNNNAPVSMLAHFPHTLKEMEVVIGEAFSNTGLSKEEISFFSARIWQLITSCSDRRSNDYERMGWWEYLEADRFSDTYRTLLVDGLTRTLVAAQATTASTRTGGDIFIQILFSMVNPMVNADRVLDGPTNDVWLKPWFNYLTAKPNVHYHFNRTVSEVKMSNYRIAGVSMKDDKGVVQTVTGDYYLFCIPVEVFSAIITPDMIAADHSLAYIGQLAPSVSWMKGIQFYLTEDIQINQGHVIFSDSEWALTCISQPQFWKGRDISKYADGKVKGIISVDVSDWFTPGMNGKRAVDCLPAEVKDEVWAQMKKALNQGGKTVIRDDQIVTWFCDLDVVDPAVVAKAPAGSKPYVVADDEPLFVNTVNSWNLRPEAHTAIPNLFLASDYVRTYTDLACMESANEAARRAVNGIIDVSGVQAPLCDVWNQHEPGILSPFRWEDAERYRKGLPWKPELSFITRFCIGCMRLFLKVYALFSKKKGRK